MAAEFGFEVAYVTYKWPQWLHQQTQQQRIIWGYKILFLDVLFPLHVKKVPSVRKRSIQYIFFLFISIGFGSGHLCGFGSGYSS